MALIKEQVVSVTVKYYVLFCIAADYCKIEAFQLKGPSDLGVLLDIICAKYGPQFHQHVFGADGRLKSTAWFIINGKKIDSESLFSVSLTDGDEVIISSPLLVGG